MKNVGTRAVTITFTIASVITYYCAFITDNQFIAGNAVGHVHLFCLEELKCRK